MQYRPFGNTGFNVSALGFGAMRLPTTKDGIDEPKATQMLRHAIDSGVNYVDTAYIYHNGESERFVGRALKDGYREKVKLATKIPSWKVNSADDFDRFCDEQLEKMQTDCIDFYLLHALDKNHWPKMRDFGALDWGEKAKADGRIGALAFSFHCEVATLKQILDEWESPAFAQIQYNLLNENYQAGTEGLEYAAEKGVPVVIMEPLLGGKLCKAPAAVQEIWDSAPAKRTPTDWALQWLWNKPEVAVVLSGMSAPEHVQENLDSADSSGVGSLSTDELDAISRAQNTYESLRQIPCTSCSYCMPCPQGVKIPRNFEIYNDGVVYDTMEQKKKVYQGMDEKARAANCIQCKECEEKCPQNIEISDWMPKIDRELSA